MNKAVEKEKNIQKRNFFDYLTEVVGWIQIVVSILLFAILPALWIYFSDPTSLRLVIAIGIVLLGLIGGIIFATKTWKTKGTINFISRASASPELDNIDNKE